MHLPPIRRGADTNTYYPTEDGLLIQYDFDRYIRSYNACKAKSKVSSYSWTV